MSIREVVDVVVVGAGVVGLAAARVFAASGRQTLVLEQHAHIGREISSRNSGVIHSGIYYPADSLKARLCVEGRHLLYEYCEQRGIAHARCGKLIVAQTNQVGALRALEARGVANGVSDLQWLDASHVRELEPELHCAAALHSPSTGIVDPHELMTALLGDLESHGGVLAANSKVERMRPLRDGIELTIGSGSEASTLVARTAINATGLGSVAMTRRIEGYPITAIPQAYFAKGNYFACSGRPFRRLVYPMPNEAGLGIHATIDLNGGTRFGPDVEWTDSLSYDVDPALASGFDQSIREYWPALDDGALQPAYAGIRPKLVGPGQPASDFVIAGPGEHGIPGLINLLGIESPGLTAALALGEYLHHAARTKFMYFIDKLTNCSAGMYSSHRRRNKQRTPLSVKMAPSSCFPNRPNRHGCCPR
jgi:L-2-hydroxyglutarate oxidase LhgO